MFDKRGYPVYLAALGVDVDKIDLGISANG
jgi:hypothetical protein